MAEPTHFWCGQKPLRIANTTSFCAYDVIVFGQSFVPSESILASFGDLLRKVELGPPEPPEPSPTSPLRTGPDGAWTRRGGRRSR